MHYASTEHVERKKHRGPPHCEVLFECHTDGRDTVGSLNAEVIILLRNNSEFWITRVLTVKPSGNYHH